MAWRGWRNTHSPKARGLRAGYRSGLEATNAALLQKHGQPVAFEQVKIKYVVPSTIRTYSLDFELANGIMVETKGIFEPIDRAKHIFLLTQHPELDIRFVFQRPNTPITKGSSTTYATWCDRYRIKWAAKTIPISWMEESGPHGRIGKAGGPRTIEADPAVIADIIGRGAVPVASLRSITGSHDVNRKRPSGLKYATPDVPYTGKRAGLPRGVHPMPNGRYRAQSRRYGKTVFLGSFATPGEAAEAYKAYRATLSMEGTSNDKLLKTRPNVRKRAPRGQVRVAIPKKKKNKPSNPS